MRVAVIIRQPDSHTHANELPNACRNIDLVCSVNKSIFVDRDSSVCV